MNSVVSDALIDKKHKKKKAQVLSLKQDLTPTEVNNFLQPIDPERLIKSLPGYQPGKKRAPSQSVELNIADKIKIREGVTYKEGAKVIQRSYQEFVSKSVTSRISKKQYSEFVAN